MSVQLETKNQHVYLFGKSEYLLCSAHKIASSIAMQKSTSNQPPGKKQHQYDY